MGTYGWGLVSEAMNLPGPRWYRWDQSGSATYWYRPDHAIEAFHAGRRGRHGIVPDIVSAVMLTSSTVRSRGGGGPSDIPASTIIPSKASNGRASAQAKKSGGPRQSSQRGGRARGKCPKGHYWSFKQKKCVKSKFRQ